MATVKVVKGNSSVEIHNSSNNIRLWLDNGFKLADSNVEIIEDVDFVETPDEVVEYQDEENLIDELKKLDVDGLKSFIDDNPDLNIELTGSEKKKRILTLIIARLANQ